MGPTQALAQRITETHFDALSGEAATVASQALLDFLRSRVMIHLYLLL